MKIAEEIVSKLISNEGFEDEITLTNYDLVKLLKEQDKITRHACAEAVLKVAEIDGYDKNGILIQTSKAHKACMNVKAV